MPDATSTLKRPPKHLIQRLRSDWRMQRDTIGVYLKKGWSLAICCCDCPRIVEWTPPELSERFDAMLDTTIAAVRAKVACESERGCGSKNVALFPHPYDRTWNWPPIQNSDAPGG